MKRIAIILIILGLVFSPVVYAKKKAAKATPVDQQEEVQKDKDIRPVKESKKSK